MANCLEIVAKLPTADANWVIDRIDALRADGVPVKTAQAQAVDELIANIEDERTALVDSMGDGLTMSKRGRDTVGGYDVKVAKDGSMTVYGDPDAIRALVPDDIKGRVTSDGVVFTTSDAPRARAGLEGRNIAYSREGQVLDRLPMVGGKYLGAPDKFDTPAKITTLRKLLRKLTDEGAPGRYWYENSSRAVLRMTGGDVQEARKFVALLAIYSPQAKVDANSTFALRAWAQYKAGQPISVKTGVMDGKAKEALDDVDAFWSGEKTGNFFHNLLREIDPSTEGKQGATIDMWMMRAGQYDNDAPTKTQHAFMENETNRLAQELGWEPQQVQAAIWVAMKARMENKGVKQATEALSEKKGWISFKKSAKGKDVRVIHKAQEHRDNWLKHSFDHDPTKDDTQAAKFDFEDGLRRNVGQISFEARPGRSTGVLPGIHNAPYEQQVEFQQAVQAAFYDEGGRNELAGLLGLLVDSTPIIPGVWQGDVSPSTQMQVPMAPSKGGDLSVDPAQAESLNLYAAVAGLVARQEGVGWHRPFYASTKKDANGVDVKIGRAITSDEASAVEGAIDSWMSENGKPDWRDSFAIVTSPEGVRLISFGAASNVELQSGILQAVVAVLPDSGHRFFASSGGMESNNWTGSQNGQDYISRISAAGRPDVLGWARDILAPRVQSVFEDFSERYGWGDPGSISFSSRSARGSRPEDRADANRSLQASEQGLPGSEDLSPLPGAPSVPGFHGPDPRLVSVANAYAKSAGIDLKRQGEYVQVDEARAKRLADAYAAMPHAPNDPKVKEAYSNLIKQTTAQYQALVKAGYKFWFVDPSTDAGSEYLNSPWNAMRDIRANQSMGIYPTDDGFGSSSFDPKDNPLFASTTFMWPVGGPDGKTKKWAKANDLFRAVHDAFGHGLEGAGFRAQGEENAWQAHQRLFTGSAVAAITSETRGQNSAVNFGPQGQANQTASGADTAYADQKTGLMPEWAWTEGVVGDAGISRSARSQTQAPEFKRWFGDSKVVDANGEPLVVYHGTAEDFPSFDPAITGKNFTRLGKQPGFFFTNNPGTAGYYSEKAALQNWYSRTTDEDDQISGAQIKPVYLSIQNPYVRKASNDGPDRWFDNNRDRVMEMARKGGHDGVIVTSSEKFGNRVMYLALEPSQIKSAIGNGGTFDPLDTDITRSSRSTGRYPQRIQPGTFKVEEHGTWDSIVEYFQNRYNRWKKVIEAARKAGGTVTEENNFYEAEERYWGIVGKGNDDFKIEMEKFIKGVVDAGLKVADVENFAYAQFAPRRNQRLGKARGLTPGQSDLSGMSDAEAQAVMNKARADGTYNALATQADKMRDIINGTRDILFNNGLITEEEYSAWKSDTFYVPLRGFDEAQFEGASFAGKIAKGLGFDIRGKEAKEAYGRESKAQNILAYIAQDRAQALIRSGKNQVLRSFLAFVLDNPNKALWEVNAVETRPTMVIDDQGNRTIKDIDTLVKEDGETISVKDAGHEIFIKIKDKALLGQMKNLNAEQASKFVSALLWVNRRLSSLFTKWNPVFPLINGFRDLQAATMGMIGENGIMSVPQFLMHVPGAMREAWRAEWGGVRSVAYEEYLASGAKTGFYDIVSLEERAKELEQLAKDMSNGKSAPKAVFDGLSRFMDAYGGAIEQGVRLAAFKVTKSQTGSTARAANVAKNITVNFNRKGVGANGLSAFFLFYNPAIQGTARMAQALKDPTTLAVLGAAMTGVASLALMNAGAGDDDDGIAWWDKIPDSVKERNLVIILPPGSKAGEAIGGSKNSPRYIKIPMAYGYNAFAVAANNFVDAARHAQDPARGRPLTEGLHKSFMALFGALVPMQEVGKGFDTPESFLMAAVPDALNPIAQVLANKSAFGKPLRPDDDGPGRAGMPDSSNYFPGAAGTLAQRASEALNSATGGSGYERGFIDIAPSTLENIVRGYGGGMASFMADIGNAAYARSSVSRDAVQKEKLPFIKQFMGVLDDQAVLGKGYENMSAIDEITNPLAKADRADTPGALDAALRLEKKHGPMAELDDAVKEARKTLKEAREDELEAINNPAMSQADKFKVMQNANKERRMAMTELNAEFVAAVRGKAKMNAKP